ncbi:MAG: class I SAM-dependent methyltransferase [Propionibacteriales bacterium]|jgi:ubiquinone/menaquinone biosynthesis C-methylase UbiE|nr:class I SAM-dependent methyltransferase [Propionibacteriales bacterium]
MLDYDEEAAHYDETRGGEARAQAAADAVNELLSAAMTTIVDVAGGTGTVAQRLSNTDRYIVVCDASAGMLRLASSRLPGHAVRARGTRLPIRDASVDAVTTIWLLHLLDEQAVATTIREAARVLRAGGRYLTTVDKASAHARWSGGPVTDHSDDVESLAVSCGLQRIGESSFVGHGQGVGAPDPVYTLLAFERVR